MSDCFEQQGVPEPARRLMGSESQIFAFEQDFAGSLRCIPMIVRFKLDFAGVKLSLRQWSQLDRETRGDLVSGRCATPADIAHYRDTLLDKIAAQTDEPPKRFAVEPTPAWAEGTSTAEPVTAWSIKIGLAPPSDIRWRALSDLQRFTLIKLTRAGHDNDNFYPAMLEFGLVTGEGRQAERQTGRPS